MKKDREVFCEKLIDSHTHCCGFDYHNFTNYRYPSVQDPDTLVHLLSCNNIDHALVFPIPYTLYYDAKQFLNHSKYVESGLCFYPFEVENNTLLKNIKRFSYESLLPFLCFSLNSKVDEQIDGMTKMIEENYVYGLKYHTWTDSNSAMELTKFPHLINFIKENDLPIIFHSGSDENAYGVHVLDFAEVHPDIRVCVAHIARFDKTFFERFTKRCYDNVYFDVAPFLNLFNRYIKTEDKSNLISIPENDSFEALMRLFDIAPSKILWGSDLPWIHTDDLKLPGATEKITYSDEVKMLKKMSSERVNAIANKNILDFMFGVEK